MSDISKNRCGNRRSAVRGWVCMISFLLLTSHFSLLTFLHAGRAGLQTKFSMVTLENLQPGESYNTRELVSLPLVVKNTGDTKTVVKLEVRPPDAANKAMVAHGYEPIPDTGWVRVGQDELEISAGESAGTDVIITVPDDDRYLNKRYQVDIHIRGTEKQFVNVGLLSNLRFTIAARRLTKEELERRKKVEEYGNNIQFDLLPSKAFAEGIPLGRDVDVDKEKKVSLKISNPNDIEFTYFVDVMSFREVELPMLEGYEGLPDNGMVKIGSREVTVPANSIKKIKMVLNIPNKEEHRGKKYGFAVKATISGTPVELNQVSRFFVTTEK